MAQLTEKPKKKLPAYVHTVFTVIISLFLVAVLLINLFTHVLPIVRYRGDGMEPTLSSGQMLILHKTEKVEPGDVIAFYFNNKLIVRRVIAVGGSQVTVEENGTVFIDGGELQEPYLTEKTLGQSNQKYPVYVQPGYVFVMGDNRAVSIDSRLSEIGVVSEERILGKVLFVF